MADDATIVELWQHLLRHPRAIKTEVRTLCIVAPLCAAPRTRNRGAVLMRPFASRARADQKVVHLLARSKLRRQPAGLFAAARPSLGRIFWIPVFGKDLRVRTALAVRGDNFAGRSKLVQPLLKSGLFYRQFASQFRGYLFMEFPQVIDGHRFQIAVFHWTHRP